MDKKIGLIDIIFSTNNKLRFGGKVFSKFFVQVFVGGPAGPIYMLIVDSVHFWSPLCSEQFYELNLTLFERGGTVGQNNGAQYLN